MAEKITLDDKEYYFDEMTEQQKYLINVIQEQQIKINEAKKDIDVASAAKEVFIVNLKKSLEEEKSETKKIAEG